MKTLGKIMLVLTICAIAAQVVPSPAHALAPCHGSVVAAPVYAAPYPCGGWVTSSVTVLPVTTAIAYAPYVVTVYPTVVYPTVVYPSPVVLPRIVTVPTYAVIR
jgi:hypothetical protein